MKYVSLVIAFVFVLVSLTPLFGTPLEDAAQAWADTPNMETATAYDILLVPTTDYQGIIDIFPGLYSVLGEQTKCSVRYYAAALNQINNPIYINKVWEFTSTVNNPKGHVLLAHVIAMSAVESIDAAKTYVWADEPRFVASRETLFQAGIRLGEFDKIITYHNEITNPAMKVGVIDYLYLSALSSLQRIDLAKAQYSELIMRTPVHHFPITLAKLLTTEHSEHATFTNLVAIYAPLHLEEVCKILRYRISGETFISFMGNVFKWDEAAVTMTLNLFGTLNWNAFETKEDAVAFCDRVLIVSPVIQEAIPFISNVKTKRQLLAE